MKLLTIKNRRDKSKACLVPIQSYYNKFYTIIYRTDYTTTSYRCKIKFSNSSRQKAILKNNNKKRQDLKICKRIVATLDY